MPAVNGWTRLGEKITSAYVASTAGAASGVSVKLPGLRGSEVMDSWRAIMGIVAHHFAVDDEVHALIYRRDWRLSVRECEVMVAVPSNPDANENSAMTAMSPHRD